MNFKQYLKESVEDQHIYDFYALNFIVTAGDKTGLDDWEIEEIEKEYKEAKYKIWNNLCADGIYAIAREGRHGEIEIELETPIDSDEEAKYKEKIRWIEKFSDMCIEIYDSLPEHISKTFDEVESVMEEITEQSIEEFLKDAIELFSLPWDAEFGGESWKKIAKAMLDFYETGPEKIKAEQVDYVVSLAHNNNVWLDKFPNHQEVKKALDRKFSANTPEDYREEIRNRKIRKWLGKTMTAVNFDTTQKSGYVKAEFDGRAIFNGKGRDTFPPFENTTLAYWFVPIRIHLHNYLEDDQDNELLVKFADQPLQIHLGTAVQFNKEAGKLYCTVILKFISNYSDFGNPETHLVDHGSVVHGNIDMPFKYVDAHSISELIENIEDDSENLAEYQVQALQDTIKSNMTSIEKRMATIITDMFGYEGISPEAGDIYFDDLKYLKPIVEDQNMWQKFTENVLENLKS